MELARERRSNLLEETCDRIRAKFKSLDLQKPDNLKVYDDFEVLPDWQQEKVFQVLSFMENLIDYAEAEHIDPISDQRLTWYALQKIGLEFPSDMFSQIESRDCVEIYTADGVQLYRNFHFFEFCSYSLEDLMTYPYFELFQRPEWLEASIHKAVGNFLGQSEDTLPLNIPIHSCYETRSRKGYAGSVQFKKIFRLKMKTQEDQPTFLVTSSLTLEPRFVGKTMPEPDLSI